jgi:hypothetical protein
MRPPVAAAVLLVAYSALLAHASDSSINAVPPIPDPPDAVARQAELRSYAASTCTSPEPTVRGAELVFGVIARGEAP